MFTSSTLHVSVPLTDLAVAFRADENDYLWSSLLPPKVVRKRTDLIRQIDKGQLLRKYDLRAGAGGRIQEVQFKVGSNLSFNAIDYAVQAVMRNTENMEADEILQYTQEQMYHALIAMHTNIEVVTVKETLRSASIMTNNVTLVASQYWDNYTSLDSDPIDDLKVGVLAVRVKTGKMPNVIAMHEYVWDRIQRHPRVLARGPVHPQGLGIVTIEGVEKILGVEPGTIRVTAQQYNVAGEDLTADFRSMIGPDTIIAYTSPPNVREYSLGHSFMFQDGSAGGDPQLIKEIQAPFVVYEFPDNGFLDPRGATIHRLVGGLDQKVLVPEAGYLIKNCVDYTNTAAYGNFLNN